MEEMIHGIAVSMDDGIILAKIASFPGVFYRYRFA
jgi:hypothetical protein